MRVAVHCVMLLFLCSPLIGCGNGPDAVFELSEPTLGLIREAQVSVAKSTQEGFGTPQELVAWEKFPIDFGTEISGEHPQAAGWKLIDGRNLYMRHCVHCHGVNGDGNGPTAKYLNPRPRDYRPGIFKFTSTYSGMKPSRDDLDRTLREGVPGTTMPSFVLLSDEERAAIIEYVRFLSIRGEFEQRLTNEFADYTIAAVDKRIQSDLDDQERAKAAGEEYERKSKSTLRREVETELEEFITEEAGELATDIADGLASDWEAAEDAENQIFPRNKRHEPTPDSIARGRELYMSEALKCYTCHGLGAKGDGVSTVDYWPIPNSDQKYAVRGLHDAWGQPQKPRNLTQGIYRGGRRPVDLYRRIFAGIKGTQMAAFENALKETTDKDGNPLSDEESRAIVDRKIWDIVNYVLDVPFEKQTPPPVLQAAKPQ